MYDVNNKPIDLESNWHKFVEKIEKEKANRTFWQKIKDFLRD